jgi:RNA polymerase sigma-70 factor (ECF subfamily)
MNGDRDDATTPSAREVVEHLYAEYGTALRSLVNRILHDRQHAEDVVQETMLRAWQRADRFGPGHGSAWGWLATVARNIAIDRIRARKVRPQETGDDVEVMHSGWRQDDHAAGVANSLAIAGALGKLGDEYRTTLVEIYLHDRTAQAAAEVLAVPVGTVKSRLHHGLRVLRRHAEVEELRAA